MKLAILMFFGITLGFFTTYGLYARKEECHRAAELFFLIAALSLLGIFIGLLAP